MTDEEAHLDRRRALTLLGGAGLAVLVGCGGGADDAGSDGGGGSTTAAAGDGADCETIPEETAGPYPGDGSNGPDVLAEKGIVRRDIRPNLGSVEGVADGVDLTIQLVVRDRGNGCGRRPGAPSTCGTATVRPTTRCTHGASPRTTTCEASRRPARTVG